MRPVRPAGFPLSHVAEHIGGKVLGDPAVTVSGLATLASAGPSDLSFLHRARYRSELRKTRAAAVIVGEADRDATALPRIVCADPYAGYALAAELFETTASAPPGVHPSAVVEAGAQIAPSASIGPHCHVGSHAVLGEHVVLGAGCVIGEGAQVGESSRLHARVTVYAGCVVGRRAIVHSGAVIGADGFGMASVAGRWHKIPQLGRVVIGDDVEIGANTTIDRGALDDTVIEEGVKLDNQIQIGHNCRVGAHTAMAGCVGVAGSTRIGRHCTVGGGAVILGHLELCDGVHVAAASVVTRSIRSPGEYAGIYPLQEKGRWARNAVLLRRLEEVLERLARPERRTKE